MTTAVEQEAVTFYSWLGADENGRKIPSSQIIHISGGESHRASDGSKIRVPVKEARFHHGVCNTSDEETIKELRRLCKVAGTGITEDKEEFYANTMTPQQAMRRQAVIGRQNAEKLDEALEENKKLRKRLEEMGKNELPERKRA